LFKESTMHPWMALWIWSMAMSRISRDAILGTSQIAEPGEVETSTRTPQAVIRVGDYLQSDLIARPLPGTLLDRLADLYWTERDSELAI
jgi:hypothetical protein